MNTVPFFSRYPLVSGFLLTQTHLISIFVPASALMFSIYKYQSTGDVMWRKPFPCVHLALYVTVNCCYLASCAPASWLPHFGVSAPLSFPFRPGLRIAEAIVQSGIILSFSRSYLGKLSRQPCIRKFSSTCLSFSHSNEKHSASTLAKWSFKSVCKITGCDCNYDKQKIHYRRHQTVWITEE